MRVYTPKHNTITVSQSWQVWRVMSTVTCLNPNPGAWSGLPPKSNRFFYVTYSPKFVENRLSSFCVIVLTHKQTMWKQNLLREGKRRYQSSISTIIEQLAWHQIKIIVSCSRKMIKIATETEKNPFSVVFSSESESSNIAAILRSIPPTFHSQAPNSTVSASARRMMMKWMFQRNK